MLWINRALEFLWLLTVFLVPLAVLRPEDMVSSTLIAYVEVPKIAVLRTLVSLMAILWLLEWGVRNHFASGLATTGFSNHIQPSSLLTGLSSWLRKQPAHWLSLAVVLFAGSTLLSTLLSTSIDVSLWGEIPGEDGYSAYTVAAYVVLFAMIATHVKTRPQLWRMVGAVVGTGVLAGSYAILQHYDQDFLRVMEPLSGTRVTSTMGNPILAGSVLLMTFSVSLTVASINLSGPVRSLSFWWKFLFWALVLAVQLSGLVLTISRGPLFGTILGVVVFLGMATVFLGWRSVLRWSLWLLFVGVITWGITSLPFDTLNKGGTETASATNIGLSVDGNPDTDGALESDSSVFSNALGRLATVGSSVSGRGGITGRFELWEPSWQLIAHRPWFEFDNLSLDWLRPAIGYGPDLFRYTFLLESPPRPKTLEGARMLPGEAVHAHNYLIHQAVELGFLGMLTSFGLFLAVFIVGGYLLFRMRASDASIYKLILIGLLATIAGRFLEQMVGLNRVADTTVFWALLGIFVALPTVILGGQSVLRPNSFHPVSPASFINVRKVAGALIVTCLVAGLGTLTWFKTINYPIAAAHAATGAEQLREGRLEESLSSLHRAIARAPDVPSHYNRKSAVYAAFGGNNSASPKIGCHGLADRESYEICLAELAYATNLTGSEKRPFNFRARLAFAESALDLSILNGSKELEEQALRFYREARALIPASYPILNQLAFAYIRLGRPEAAVRSLEQSLSITEETMFSVEAFRLLGIAYQELGEPLKALEQFSELVNRTPTESEAFNSRGYIYGVLGQVQRAIEDFDQAIVNDPLNAEAYANRGLAYRALGQPQTAIEDLDMAIQLDSTRQTAFNNRGLAYADLGRYREAVADYDEAIKLEPRNAQTYINRGLAYGNLGLAVRAVEDSQVAVYLEPELANGYAARAMAYTRLYRDEDAEEDVERAVRLGFDRVVLQGIIGQLRQNR